MIKRRKEEITQKELECCQYIERDTFIDMGQKCPKCGKMNRILISERMTQ